MTVTAFLLILLSVFLHTGWNFMTKAHHPSVAFLLIANGVAALILLPFAFFARVDWNALPETFWLLLTGSVLAEIVYACGLAKAYQQNEISMAYPLMRALPVLSIAAITWFWHLGKTPSAVAVSGMALVAVGCLILPQKDFKSLQFKSFCNASLLPILIAAAGTTGYTICDSQALGIMNQQQLSHSVLVAGVYSLIMEVGLTLGLSLYVFCVPEERTVLRKVCLGSLYPYLCGIFSCGAYLLVLIAMLYVTNVSFLQAFRQMSLPLGVAAGILLLHEKNTYPKRLGSALIVLGLIMTVLPDQGDEKKAAVEQRQPLLQENAEN